jgi:hypothetical protein
MNKSKIRENDPIKLLNDWDSTRESLIISGGAYGALCDHVYTDLAKGLYILTDEDLIDHLEEGLLIKVFTGFATEDKDYLLGVCFADLERVCFNNSDYPHVTIRILMERHTISSVG